MNYIKHYNILGIIQRSPPVTTRGSGLNFITDKSLVFSFTCNRLSQILKGAVVRARTTEICITYNKEQFSQRICFPTEKNFCLQPDLHEIWHEGGP